MKYEIDLKDLSDAYLNDDSIKELDEVYRKAEAFDAIWSHYDRYYEDEDRPVMEQFGEEVADIILNEYEQKCKEGSQ